MIRRFVAVATVLAFLVVVVLVSNRKRSDDRPAPTESTAPANPPSSGPDTLASSATTTAATSVFCETAISDKDRGAPSDPSRLTNPTGVQLDGGPSAAHPGRVRVLVEWNRGDTRSTEGLLRIRGRRGKPNEQDNPVQLNLELQPDGQCDMWYRPFQYTPKATKHSVTLDGLWAAQPYCFSVNESDDDGGNLPPYPSIGTEPVCITVDWQPSWSGTPHTRAPTGTAVNEIVGGCEPFAVFAQNRWAALGAVRRAEPIATATEIGQYAGNEIISVNGWIRARAPYPTNTSPWNSDVWFHVTDGGWVAFAAVRADPTFEDKTLLSNDGGRPVPLDLNCSATRR
jgi:hypothetical protein